MIVPAIMYLVALGVIVGGLVPKPHSFSGRFALLALLVLGCSGLALAIGALDA